MVAAEVRHGKGRAACLGLGQTCTVKRGGLGRLLLDRIVRYAKAQGLQRLVAVVLRENDAMLRLARGAGFVVDPARPSERDIVERMLALHDAAPG